MEKIKRLFLINRGDAITLLVIGLIAAVSLLGMIVIPLSQQVAEAEPPPFVYDSMELATTPYRSGDDLQVWISGHSEQGERIYLIVGDLSCDNGFSHTFDAIYRPSSQPLSADFTFAFRREMPVIAAGTRCTYTHGAMDMIGSEADTVTTTFEVQEPQLENKK